MKFLTDDEQECLSLLSRAANVGFKIIREGGNLSEQQTGSRCDQHDASEWAHHIHLCQQQIMAQAAGRAYPKIFRLLGGSHAEDNPPPPLNVPGGKV